MESNTKKTNQQIKVVENQNLKYFNLPAEMEFDFRNTDLRVIFTANQNFNYDPLPEDRDKITNFNTVVNNNDVVFHCGNFGNPKMVKYLNGLNHFLILDKNDLTWSKDTLDCFDDVFIAPVYISLQKYTIKCLPHFIEKTIKYNEIADNIAHTEKYQIEVDVNINNNRPLISTEIEEILKNLITRKESKGVCVYEDN